MITFGIQFKLFVFEGSNNKLEEKSYLLCETVNYLHTVRSPNTKNKHITKWVFVVTHPEKITHRVEVDPRVFYS